jgi:hypothetical protein
MKGPELKTSVHQGKEKRIENKNSNGIFTDKQHLIIKQRYHQCSKNVKTKLLFTHLEQ